MNIRSMNSQQKLKLCRELIREYKMKPLTFEGGFYLETFRSDTCSSILFNNPAKFFKASQAADSRNI